MREALSDCKCIVAQIYMKKISERKLLLTVNNNDNDNDCRKTTSS